MAVAGSRPHRQLEAGIYFSRDDEQVLREGQAVNDLGETSLDKLGWMRKEQGAWSIRKGLVKITDAQVRVHNA
jgi:predicted NUDIX family NTP pyrophosphohydrolase